MALNVTIKDQMIEEENMADRWRILQAEERFNLEMEIRNLKIIVWIVGIVAFAAGFLLGHVF